MMSDRGQQGVALISALLVIAIVLMLSTSMVISLRFIIHKAQLSTSNDQMELVLQGVNDWAEMMILYQADVTKIKPLILNIQGIHVVGQIDAIRSCRMQSACFNAMSEFLRGCSVIPSLSANTSPMENFFIVRGQASQGRYRMTIMSFLEKQIHQNSQVSIKTLWQQFDAV